MTFLQPYILWGLPLVLVPVIIHLINRLRHRPQPWAAMMFLVQASRSSTSHAKLKQWLILLFRVLAVLMLVLFISRPIAGGWLGWALSPSPDAIVMVLDRSASMETKLPGSSSTRREQALKMLAQAARPFEASSQLVLIDSALHTPQRMANADNLASLSLTTPTDTAADLPALLQTAFNWMLENRSGATEIWIATDLQRSNWRPNDDRWKTLVAQFASLQQRLRIRLLTFNEASEADARVSVAELVRRQSSGQSELQLVLDLQRNVSAAETVPVTVTLNGTHTQYEVAMEGQSLRWRQTLSLGDKKNGGWGSVQLPADANARNNTAYFVYGAETTLKATVISNDKGNARFFKLAAEASAGGARQSVNVFASGEIANAPLDDQSVILWQAPLPQGAAEQRLREFVETGGVILFFPTGQAETNKFLGVSWGAVQTAANEKTFRIERWEDKEGPLAKTDEGFNLPLHEAIFLKRQLILGEKDALATYDDGTPFLTQRVLSKGRIYFCATLPQKEWSTLGDGPVLVPMIQRALLAGSRRLTQATMMTCGELSAVDANRPWVAVDVAGPRNIQTDAGVYRAGDRLVAVNRPAAEDERELVTAPEARALFGTLPVQMLDESRTRNDRLQGEIWRLFLVAMLLFLLVEGVLILPTRAETAATGKLTQPNAEVA